MKKLVLAFHEGVRDCGHPRLSRNNSTDTSSAPKASFRFSTESPPVVCQNNTAVRVFPVRAKDDSSVISFWSEYLEKQLPEILSPRIGKSYSAGLVRQGEKSLRAKATIRSQNPNG